MMKNTILLLLIISAMYSFVFAQSPLPTLKKVKQIKLLESTRKDVKKILAEYIDDNEDDDYDQWFSNKDAEINILFSKGNCSFSKGYCSNDSEFWNVPEWVVTSVSISPENSVKIKDINLDLSKFKKEDVYKNHPEDYTLHNVNSGILISVGDGEINTIIFYPPKNKQGFLCNNQLGLEVLSGERRFVDYVRQTRDLINIPAVVTELILSKTEIVIGCSVDSAKNKSCPTGKREISITTDVVDPENDVLTYNYKISGGEIIGKGANVIWDLSDVKSGTYTITAGVDDGCGVRSKTVTKAVIVKECSDCSTEQ